MVLGAVKKTRLLHFVVVVLWEVEEKKNRKKGVVVVQCEPASSR